MTSNAGSNLNSNSLGFGKQTIDSNKMVDALKQTFRPEFLNRIDEIIIFKSLEKEQLIQIIDLMLKDTQTALNAKDITLEISPEAKEFILSKGTDTKYGARPLRRAIQRYIEDAISDMILKSEVKYGQKISVILENDELKFNIL